MTINRDGKTIELTADELSKAYGEYRMKIHFPEWIAFLLEEYGYPKQTDEMLLEMAQVFVDRVEDGSQLGELEHDIFEYMMEYDYPEIECEENEDEEE